jgi:hypothetical protein
MGTSLNQASENAMNILPPANYESLYACFVSRLSARAAAKKCDIDRGTATLYYRRFKNGERPSAARRPDDFPPGCRVCLNKTYIYGGAGRMGTVVRASEQGWNSGMGWLAIKMDDVTFVDEWHHSYFDRTE